MSLFFTFIVPFFIGIVVVQILLKISPKNNFLFDVPEGDVLKIHKKSIPLAGGLAMLLAILGYFIFFGHVSLEILKATVALLIVFFLGFWDDLKWKHTSTIKPLLKFTLLLICTLISAVILSWAGISFHFFPIQIISIILAFIYIFVSINAVNYQDGMDGLAGGLVFISLSGFLTLSLVSYNDIGLMLSLVTMGAVAAFLAFNLPPAKIFMGDSGAYSLGFTLTVLAILFSKSFNFYSVIGPMFIIGLPIFDGVYTNIRRLMAGKSIFLGDRAHFYDKLLMRGFSTQKTLVICFLIQGGLVLIGLMIYLYGNTIIKA